MSFYRALQFRVGLLAALAFAPAVDAWDHPGHRMVGQVALASLPKDFPNFARTPASAERILFLVNVPDRWRNIDPWLRQAGPSWTDHYFDIEQVADAGLDLQNLPSLRYDFAVAFAAGRAAHADNFPPIDPAKNTDHTREWIGFAPWSITEWYQKLRSAFSYLKAYEEVDGTPEEIANAKADVVYAMGVMGHYVGDGAQPLHTSKHHAGWVGENPSGYTTWAGFHTWIDSGLINKSGITYADLVPRLSVAEPLAVAPRADGRDPFFVVALDYLTAQNQLLEPLYRLDKAGLLGNREQPVAPEGRAFVEGQLLTGGTMLARVWVTAWKTAPIDTYLRTQILGKRQMTAGTPAPAATPASSKKSDR